MQLAFASHCFGTEQPRRRIGLALSGGGARGAAQIGVLKVLEREGVRIDCIAGTSFGAIVGGLYGAGYCSAIAVYYTLPAERFQTIVRFRHRSAKRFAEEPDRAEPELKSNLRPILRGLGIQIIPPDKRL